MPPIVLDLAGESNIDEFLVPFIERLERIDVVPSPENILRVIQNALELLIVEHNIRSITLPEISNKLKPIFFYLNICSIL
jgi:hypothetical protein